jgi:hypothetical protein
MTDHYGGSTTSDLKAGSMQEDFYMDCFMGIFTITTWLFEPSSFQSWTLTGNPVLEAENLTLDLREDHKAGKQHPELAKDGNSSQHHVSE